jgi:hypothetical protein
LKNHKYDLINNNLLYCQPLLNVCGSPDIMTCSFRRFFSCLFSVMVRPDKGLIYYRACGTKNARKIGIPTPCRNNFTTVRTRCWLLRQSVQGVGFYDSPDKVWAFTTVRTKCGLLRQVGQGAGLIVILRSEGFTRPSFNRDGQS